MVNTNYASPEKVKLRYGQKVLLCHTDNIGSKREPKKLAKLPQVVSVIHVKHSECNQPTVESHSMIWNETQGAEKLQSQPFVGTEPPTDRGSVLTNLVQQVHDTLANAKGSHSMIICIYSRTHLSVTQICKPSSLVSASQFDIHEVSTIHSARCERKRITPLKIFEKCLKEKEIK